MSTAERFKEIRNRSAEVEAQMGYLDPIYGIVHGDRYVLLQMFDALLEGARKDADECDYFCLVGETCPHEHFVSDICSLIGESNGME